MRKYGWISLILVGMLAVGGMLFQPFVSHADNPSAEAKRTLDVIGQATMVVKYDTATLSFGVSELHPTAVEAYQAMGKQMNAVVEALKSKGIKEEQLKTGTLSLQPEYEWLKEDGQKLRGFRATNSLSVETQELDQVAELMQIAVEAGANQVNGVSFSVKNKERLVQSALDLAVDNAKEKAERVAKRLGTQVAGVYSVQVHDQSGSPVRYEMARKTMAADSASSAPVFQGDGELSVSISVTFELR
jgi:uncharacterized protein YggE